MLRENSSLNQRGDHTHDFDSHNGPPQLSLLVYASHSISPSYDTSSSLLSPWILLSLNYSALGGSWGTPSHDNDFTLGNPLAAMKKIL
jgi:hypothetical protein